MRGTNKEGQVSGSSQNGHQGNLSSGFLTVQTVADYLNLKVSTLYVIVEEMRIPHYRLGRLIRFKRSEIDAWMEGQKEPVGDARVRARKLITAPQKKPDLTVNEIVKKAIDEAGKKRYTSLHGKPDQSKGLGKEVSDGTV